MHETNGDAVSYRTPGGLSVTRLEPRIGARIDGADLCRDLPPAVAADIRDALLAHGVIFFRDQPIDYPHHLALAKVFGDPLKEGFDPDRPEIMSLESSPESRNQAAGFWHSDGTFLPVAPSVSVLHAVKAAPLGGDTCFSSAVAAYEGLPEEVKQRIAPLRALGSLAYVFSRLGTPGYREPPPPAAHPVVRVHPETGRPALYVNEQHTAGIVGMDDAEGAALLHFLTDEIKRPEYQVRWTWTDHAIAIWDNRAVQHYAVPDEAGYRHVERITVAGTPSVGLEP
jgi:alpha-ketoglutarate-dependent taurine dioxygenase